MSQTIDLTPSTACPVVTRVKRVKESLEQRPDVEQADVTGLKRTSPGSASAEALIETIKQAGYGAGVKPI